MTSQQHRQFNDRAIAITRRVALGGVGAGIVTAALGRQASPISAHEITAQSTPTAFPAIVEQWAAAWNGQDGIAMANLFTEDGVYEDLAFEAYSQGREQVGQWVPITLDTISDLRVEVTSAFQSGSMAGAEWIFSGTQTGMFPPDIPATGRSFQVRATSIFELEGDLIRRASDYYNFATIFRQVGLSPDLYVPAGPLATPIAE